MNSKYESTAFEEWDDWCGPVDFDGISTHVPSTTVYDLPNDRRSQLPVHLPTESLGQHANFVSGAHGTYFESYSSYGYIPQHLSGQGMPWPASTTPPDAGLLSSPSASPTQGPYSGHVQNTGASPWSAYDQQHEQAHSLMNLEITRRASDPVEASPSWLGAHMEPGPRIPTSDNAIARTDPPPQQTSDEAIPRRQNPKFVNDQYTARWVRGDGTEREGWCGLCSSWHKLKDSAYWYHMHYTHGISYTTGKEFDKPVEWRPANSAAGAEALCGGCRQWIYIGRHDGGKWKTPYYRHAYRCQTKNKANGQSIRNRPKSTSPRRSAAKQVKRL
ncbi:Meiotic expression up-regulated protein 26 [Fulvia fulva]|uniref:Meiotic expression up-regulated protein 26 n=1 Tax=Passalora fulva TaxID=5499 RepID=A0A9Q8L6H6_PASFU|nr:Meiotic expression up-regulated protein 26 [Fulvia fulva]KAK4638536.1 Meiotic expression up-regulated protein 26 [Fulvia fulva]UJO11755.1 Meiotic expression up-regulated protein 26 [Fulvia fulva]WPV10426.1 Meiotic expression up-regulated protein 26 [Fulvia fulva]